MPRGPLPKAQKEKMQAARKTVAKDRESALKALEANTQFTHPKFWAAVDPEKQEEVLKAIRKAQRGAKKAEVARLMKKVAKLEADLQGA